MLNHQPFLPSSEVRHSDSFHWAWGLLALKLDWNDGLSLSFHINYCRVEDRSIFPPSITISPYSSLTLLPYPYHPLLTVWCPPLLASGPSLPFSKQDSLPPLSPLSPFRSVLRPNQFSFERIRQRTKLSIHSPYSESPFLPIFFSRFRLLDGDRNLVGGRERGKGWVPMEFLLLLSLRLSHHIWLLYYCREERKIDWGLKRRECV